MADVITVTGTVATDIKHTVTAEGLEVSNFRLASNHRRFDNASRKWIDAETNWYSIASFRQLAANVAASLVKGNRVVVTGRLRVREWGDGEHKHQDVEIVAEALGPDLAWGTAQYTRTPRALAAVSDPTPDPEAADADPGESFPTDAQVQAALPF